MPADAKRVALVTGAGRGIGAFAVHMGRTGQPEGVAALVSWLASGECTFGTGAVFDISGGRATS